MTCGTKLQGRNWGYSEREEIADKLERDGEYDLAQKVRREQCLGFFELTTAESALERQGISSYDYREERCHCSEEEEQYDG